MLGFFGNLIVWIGVPVAIFYYGYRQFKLWKREGESEEKKKNFAYLLFVPMGLLLICALIIQDGWVELKDMEERLAQEEQRVEEMKSEMTQKEKELSQVKKELKQTTKQLEELTESKEEEIDRLSKELSEAQKELEEKEQSEETPAWGW